MVALVFQYIVVSFYFRSTYNACIIECKDPHVEVTRYLEAWMVGPSNEECIIHSFLLKISPQ